MVITHCMFFYAGSQSFLFSCFAFLFVLLTSMPCSCCMRGSYGRRRNNFCTIKFRQLLRQPFKWLTRSNRWLMDITGFKFHKLERD